MIFFKKKTISYKGYSIPSDESYRISKLWNCINLITMVLSGLLLSSAFPPLNWEIAAFAAISLLILQSIQNPPSWRLFFYGYVWSLSWSFCAFFWLREINCFIPPAIAAIFGLWGGVYAVLNSFLFRYVLRSKKTLVSGCKQREKADLSWAQCFIFSILSGGLFIALEYIRIRLFPWNFIGVTQYKMLYLIQIVKWCGIYGVSFIIVSVNSVIALVLWCAAEKYRGKEVKYKGAMLNAAVFSFIILAAVIFGYFEYRSTAAEYENGRTIRFGVVQGDISQRRFSDQQMAQEALDVYIKLSYLIAEQKPQIIIWPETAVPYPFFAGNLISAHYRKDVYSLVTSKKIPLLVGTLDFIRNTSGEYNMTNSAFLISSSGRVDAKYSKIYRVPYGEFVPLREYLPQSWIDRFSMGRDLYPGDDPTPLEILPGVRAGMAICYESIFASLARDEANLGANILIAINNDAWYPESSEPEQHAANAVFRAVETGLPALRSGNNGASICISPSGKIIWSLSGKLLNRERTTGIAEVKVQERPSLTFYSRFGDVFLFGIFCIIFTALIYGTCQYFSILACLKNDSTGNNKEE